ncbi:hypothetical protein M5D96_013682, partial [Drosophila gunungcola]
MAEREREELSASFSRLLRTLSSASMSRRPLCAPPLALQQPVPVRQNEMESAESTERCCSSCSDDSNNNGVERETEATELESKEEVGEQDELELKRDSTVNVNVVRANFKCNDMECSLVLGDYVN